MPDRIRLRSLAIRRLAIPFTARFRHASAERSETSSVWVAATSADDVMGYGESCPRPYVTDETLDSAEAFFRRHEARLRREIDSLAALRRWAGDHQADLDANPAAWCAIELAILDLLGKTQAEPIETVLSLAPLAGAFQYSAVLGDADEDTFARTADRYRGMGFTDLKVKLSGDLDRDRRKMEILAALRTPGLRVRVDANNLWRDADAAIACLAALDGPLAGVEEPVTPGRFDELARIGQALGVPIVLDESVTRMSHLGHLTARPDLWIVNVRVSKMGGLLRALGLIETLRGHGVRVIVGAQVGETSLLTRAGLTVAQAAGPTLVAQEGAFGTFLLERDVCDPPLMFGTGGRLEVDAHPRLGAPGLGIETPELPPASR
jgi:L-alanine-DL-glutamate epimerase-like enolase superfamily enzyme